jgi:internalin A
LRRRPEVKLRVYQSGKEHFTDLDFFSHFPTVRRLSIELFWLKNIDGFDAVEDLDEFTFGWTNKKTYSLTFMRRFKSLRKLYLEGHRKDIDAITALTGIQNLTLRSMTMPNLEMLTLLPQLRHLEIKLGGTKNLQALKSLNLEYLELCLVKGLSDVSVIGELESLEALFFASAEKRDPTAFIPQAHAASPVRD